MLTCISDKGIWTKTATQNGISFSYTDKVFFVPLDVQLPALPQTEEEIQHRIDNGFRLLRSSGTIRAQVETLNPEYTDFVLAYKLEASVNQESIAIHVTTPKWESIQIQDQYWLNTENGWYETSGKWTYNYAENPDILPKNLFSLTEIQSDPYQTLSPTYRSTFHSRTIGYELTQSGLAEAYEVGLYRDSYLFMTTQIWINAASGVVMKTVNPTIKVVWELDDSIVIKAPCSDSC